MKYATIFWCVTLGCVYKAVLLGGWGLGLLWPGISFGIAGAAYAGLGPGLFGKRGDGSLRPLRAMVLFPYLLYTWSLWHIWRLCAREAPYHELCDGVKIGRRLLPHEFPEDVVEVFDLTSEFPEPSRIRARSAYHCYPTLDAMPLQAAVLRQAAQQVLNATEGVYIHCANGHGRTGTLAGAVLLLGGRCKTADGALDFLRVCRPGLSLNGRQKAALLEFASSVVAGADGSANSNHRLQPTRYPRAEPKR